MELDLNMQEELILHQLIFDTNDDIVLKTDLEGFVCYASPAIEQLGFPLSDMLIWPHILDLVGETFRPAIGNAFESALNGRRNREWIEFRCPLAEKKGQWFAIRFATLRDAQGNICGTLGIVRNLGEARHLEEQLFRAEMTDPLTGLTNRQAWMAMLDHLLGCRNPSSLALIDIDFFKAINLHYGVSSGDRFLVSFAEFLRSETPGHISISRVGASRFGMLFPGWPVDRAESICRDVVHALSKLHCKDWRNRFSVTASVGIAEIAADVDATVKSAESALRLARAKGGNTVTIDRELKALGKP